MKPEIVIALYRPHPGKEAELRALIARHVPTLRRLELVTDRPPVLCRAADGTYMEIFEWATAEAADQAHHHPEVAKLWEPMGRIADFATLESLEEVSRPFPHFEPVAV